MKWSDPEPAPDTAPYENLESLLEQVRVDITKLVEKSEGAPIGFVYAVLISKQDLANWYFFYSFTQELLDSAERPLLEALGNLITEEAQKPNSTDKHWYD